jgi:tetratricopeptide (TPR) repeat protein
MAPARPRTIMRRLAQALLASALAAASAVVPARADENSDRCFKDEGEAAIAACTRAIQSARYSGGTLAAIYHNRAIELRQDGDYDRAIADYGQAIHIDAEFTGAYAGRGLAHEGKGEVEQAKTDYRKALAVAPKYEDGQWAHEMASARLKALGES